MADRLYTTNQLAKLFGVVPTTVIDWIEAGKLEAFKTLGGHRRISHLAVLRFLRKHDLPSPPAFAELGSKILVLDDELEALDLFRRLLQRSFPDVEVLISDHPVDALVRIGADRPELVVFDIYMPDMDGFEFCRRLRRSQIAELRLLAVSGDDSEATRRRMLDCGADAFLSKAEAPSKLVEACDQLLAGSLRARAVPI